MRETFFYLVVILLLYSISKDLAKDETVRQTLYWIAVVGAALILAFTPIKETNHEMHNELFNLFF